MGGKDDVIGKRLPPVAVFSQYIDGVSVEHQRRQYLLAEQGVYEVHYRGVLPQAAADEQGVVLAVFLDDDLGGAVGDDAGLGLGQGQVGRLGKLGGEDGVQAGRSGQRYQPGAGTQDAVAGEVGGADVVYGAGGYQGLAETPFIGVERAFRQVFSRPVAGDELGHHRIRQLFGDADIGYLNPADAGRPGEAEKPLLGHGQGDGGVGRDTGGVYLAVVGIEPGRQIHGDDVNPAALPG